MLSRPQAERRAREIACGVFLCENFHEDGCLGLTTAITDLLLQVAGGEPVADGCGMPGHTACTSLVDPKRPGTTWETHRIQALGVLPTTGEE